MPSEKPLFQLTYEAKRQFLHYFRHILREITYLPDPLARSVHRAQIRQRFRKYQPTKQDPSLPPHGVSQKLVRDEEHLNKLLEDCRKRLAWQYRASNGDLTALKKALFLAYGRVGPRKHTLLQPYLKPDIPEGAKELEEALQETRSRKLPLSTALKAITKEQNRQGKNTVGSLRANTTRFLENVLPERNAWGRPMPLKRVVNAKRKQFGELVDKLYPPLPDDEFKRLEGLAKGTLPCPPLPIRRTRLEGLPELPKISKHHKITVRTMQRLWSEITGLSSTIERNETTGAYKVSWGTNKYPAIGMPKEGTVGSKTLLFAETIEPL